MAPLFGGRNPIGKPGEWFYCIRHKKVEEGPECPARDRLGPYATPGEAQRAVEISRERNREWDTDPRWHDEPEEPDADPDPRG